MSGKNPLNPPLFDALEATFNDVIIVNPGAKFEYTLGSWNGRPSIRKKAGTSSEEYRVNCPCCNDTRQRCYINHSSGAIIDGVKAPILAKCFNEDCESDGLIDCIKDIVKDFDAGEVKLASSKAAATAAPVDTFQIALNAYKNHERLPGVRKLNVLADSHSANDYVRRREFDPAYLSEIFGIGYFDTHTRYEYRAKAKRLIIPVHYGELEVGWLARAIPGFTPSIYPAGHRQAGAPIPKYLNSIGFPKSMFLYNYNNAFDYDVIVVVEGPTDVWRVGPWAVALMGKSMSDAQCALLCKMAEKKGAWIVLMGDAPSERDDSVTSWKRNYQKLVAAYKYPARVRLHILDKGDPGDRSQQELNDIVNRVMNMPIAF